MRSTNSNEVRVTVLLKHSKCDGYSKVLMAPNTYQYRKRYFESLPRMIVNMKCHCEVTSITLEQERGLTLALRTGA
jgi:hypothetical protein